MGFFHAPPSLIPGELWRIKSIVLPPLKTLQSNDKGTKKMGFFKMAAV
jgi:hypothetical protein